MGGYGSGRPGRRITTQASCRLDITIIQGQGCIVPGARTQSTQRWIQTRSGKETSIGLMVDYRSPQPAAELLYAMHVRDAEPVTRRVPVAMSITQPNYGGLRYWWHCPRCDQRVRILYLPPGAGDFRCRVCWHLTYESSNESDKRVSALVNDQLKLLAMSNDAPAGMSSNVLLLLKAYAVLERRGY
jgi:hypothetical protein